MGCCENLVRTFLFVTNFLICVLSCAIVGLCIWVLVDKPSLVNILDQTESGIPIYDSAVILFLVMASLAVFISFFGCCGAYKENRCMLGTYFLMVLGLLIMVVAGTVIALAQHIDTVITPLKDTLYLYDKSSTRLDTKEITDLWDSVQTEFHCCGVESPRDWGQYNPRYDGQGYFEYSDNVILFGPKVPESCCHSAKEKAKCMTEPSGKNGAYQVGCFTYLYNDIRSHIDIVGGVAITIIVVMTLNLFIALYMCTCSIADDNDVMGRPRKRRYVRPGEGPA